MSEDINRPSQILPNKTDTQEQQEAITGMHIIKTLFAAEQGQELPSIIYTRYTGFHNVETIRSTMDDMVRTVNAMNGPTYVIVNFEGVKTKTNALVDVGQHEIYEHKKVKAGLVYGMDTLIKLQNTIVARKAVKPDGKENPTPVYYKDINDVVAYLVKYEFPEDLGNSVLDMVNKIEAIIAMSEL